MDKETKDGAKQEAAKIGACLGIVFGVPFVILVALVLIGFIISALR